MTQKIGRAVVRSQPEPIFAAEANGVLHLVVPSQWIGGDDNEVAVIIGIGTLKSAAEEVIPIPYGDSNNPVLPRDRAFPVELSKGEAVWALSPGQAFLSFTWVSDVV
jgi:hypothetical protein